MTATKEKLFTPYQAFIIAIVAILNFVIILDFMVLSPLGAILMPALKITPAQFAIVVSAYAVSAGISGLLAAGFADKFDRKKFLLFFYFGFLIGTLLCAIAPTYELLLAARIVTGIFGGVIGSVSFAIITDLFKVEVRGRVMGFTQMAFGASQVLGLPIGLLLANRFNWHAPFWMIVIFGTILGLVMILFMKPVTEHLKVTAHQNAFHHLLKNLTKEIHIRAFISTILLATGGFMLMPFGSAFATNNLGLKIEQLPSLYLVTGLFGLAIGPLIGKLADSVGRFKLFFIGSILTIIIVAIYTQLEITPLWIIMILNVIMFAGINARMISASALISTIPLLPDRGAFMSINASIQQISGGIASFIAGLIVVQLPSGHLERYDLLGYVVIGSMVITIGLIYWLDEFVNRKRQKHS
jgi:predicted MFS family arabinose efflux permease